MNQGQLAGAIAKRFFLKKTESAEIIEFVLSKIQAGLKAGRRVYFRGFGSFTKRIRPARRVRHPGTGRIIVIPAGPHVDFNPSPRLLRALNQARKGRRRGR